MQKHFINTDDGKDILSASLSDLVECELVNDILHCLDTNRYQQGELDDCLIKAAMRGLDSVVRSLLANGANVSHRQGNSASRTPLHFAIEYGHHALARLLLENGAEVMASAGRNNTPMYKAIKRDALDFVTLLCEHSADVNWVAANEDPFIISAVGCRSLAILRFLLEHGADPNVRSQLGHSPLYLAVHFRSPEMASLLLQHGADVKVEYKSGIGLIEVALLLKDSDTRLILESHIGSNGALIAPKVDDRA